MNIDDEMLMAYADGELRPDAAAAVEAAMAADPAVAAAVARHRALRERLRASFAAAVDEPVPARLAAMLSDDARVVPLRPAAGTRRRARTWLAMAASLAAGVLVAQWLPSWPSSPVGDDMAARGALARGLDRQLSGETDGPVVAGLSFRATDGRYCRTFRSRIDAPVAGLACRDCAHWRVVALATDDASTAGDLRTASSLPPAVLAEVDERLDGEPLDAVQERVARDAGWR